MLSRADRRFWIVVAAVVSALGGCSTLQDVAGIARAGHQPDGTYVLSAEEQELPCRHIRSRLAFLSQQLQALPERAALEQKSQPSTVSSAFGRLFGAPGAGLHTTRDFQKVTAESDALNALLVQKQCV